MLVETLCAFVLAWFVLSEICSLFYRMNFCSENVKSILGARLHSETDDFEIENAFCILNRCCTCDNNVKSRK